MTKQIVDETILTKPYVIRPEDIRPDERFWDAFGNTETEISAWWIVHFCTEQGGWKPFTAQDIEEFYCRNSQFSGFRFNNLLQDEFVVLGDDEKYRVTHEFISRCFKSSPAKRIFAALS